jgi:Tfp pilus assembly protein FimT
MVVVVIIGILSAIAVPKFIQTTGESQLDGDANALYQDLQWTKLQALKNSDTFVVQFTTVTTSGTPNLVWTIYESLHDASGNHKYTQVKQGVAGVSVAVGLPSAISPPTSTQLGGYLSGMTTYSSGYQNMNGTSTGCRQPDNGTTTIETSEKWSDGITICGGSGIANPDIETGAIYLYSTRSPARAVLIMADRSKALTFQRFRYFGGAWGTI